MAYRDDEEPGLWERGAGQRYHVVYSPASKIVWELEPPDLCIRG